MAQAVDMSRHYTEPGSSCISIARVKTIRIILVEIDLLVSYISRGRGDNEGHKRELETLSLTLLTCIRFPLLFTDDWLQGPLYMDSHETDEALTAAGLRRVPGRGLVQRRVGEVREPQGLQLQGHNHSAEEARALSELEYLMASTIPGSPFRLPEKQKVDHLTPLHENETALRVFTALEIKAASYVYLSGAEVADYSRRVRRYQEWKDLNALFFKAIESPAWIGFDSLNFLLACAGYSGAELARTGQVMRNNGLLRRRVRLGRYREATLDDFGDDSCTEEDEEDPDLLEQDMLIEDVAVEQYVPSFPESPVPVPTTESVDDQGRTVFEILE